MGKKLTLCNRTWRRGRAKLPRGSLASLDHGYIRLKIPIELVAISTMATRLCAVLPRLCEKNHELSPRGRLTAHFGLTKLRLRKPLPAIRLAGNERFCIPIGGVGSAALSSHPVCFAGFAP